MSAYRRPAGPVAGQPDAAAFGATTYTSWSSPTPGSGQATHPTTSPLPNSIPASPMPLVSGEATGGEGRRANRSSRSYKTRRSRAVLLSIPIAGRLTLAFLAAALIATIAAGVVGFQRSQSLTREADFYQHLLQSNSALNTAASYLQLMNTKLHDLLTNATSPAFSQETQDTDEKALQALTTHFNAILSDYVKNDFVDQHPDQLNLLTEAGNQIQAQQQHTLVASAQRTWLTFIASQQTLLNDINAKNFVDATTLIRAQEEPTNADALSAMRTLIQLGSSLARSVNDAAVVEQQTLLITTIIIAAIACLCIGLFGWFISRTLVQRLNLLRRVTQMVEKGQLDSRVVVMGRDEIADVSTSVNSMLDTIVGLLQETRSQRDAMTNAANHLFSYMQVVSAGELRANTVAHNDPIGMLADAFNFTIGRVRRFMLRSQTNVERLEVILRQEMEHTENFMQLIQGARQSPPIAYDLSGKFAVSGPLKARSGSNAAKDSLNPVLVAQLKQAQQHLLQGVRSLAQTYIRTMLMQTKQLNATLTHIKQYKVQKRGFGTEYTLPEQDLNTLEMLVQEMDTVMSGMQASASKELSEVEKILNQSLITLRSSEKEPQQAPAIEMAPVSDLTQLAMRFVQDNATLTRQIVAIVQELRANVNNFKIDADGPAPFSPATAPSGNLKF